MASSILRIESADLTKNMFYNVATQMKLYSVDIRHKLIEQHLNILS